VADGNGSVPVTPRRHSPDQLGDRAYRFAVEALGTVWIYGFWTGLNYVAAASDQAQAQIDMGAIVAEVEKTCTQQASQTLASAVWTTYLGVKR
jgi:hypothetical protein